MKHNRAIDELEDLLESGDINLISFGLAPNPFGFCFEVSEGAKKEQIERVSKLLDGLDENEVEYLRINYL